mmetsp:Transcript_38578/g.50845  ORF Transcript_38578/g.50845 Transcript_38578/m.50845 type:complete len:480 (+) Transcript_38578:216-1655(+)
MVDQRFIGVLLNISGSVTLNLGTNVMKLGHNIRQNASLASADDLNRGYDDSVHSISSIASEKLGPRPKVWYVGMALFVIGSLVTFSSFGFAPQSLLAALGSCQFISNCIFGSLILKEKLTRKTIIGTCVILAGNVIVIWNSPSKADTYSSSDLLSFYTYLEYQLFLLAELFLLICLQITYTAYEDRLNLEDPGKPPYWGTSVVMPICYAMFSAAIGTQSALQAKCFSELLNSSVVGENQFSGAFVYFVILAWFATTVFWLYRMNRALALFDGLFIIPTLQVFWVFFAIIGGGMFFREFQTMSKSKIFGFICGVLVVFSGVFILAPTLKDKERKAKEEREEDDEVPEPTISDLLRMAYYDKKRSRLLNFGFDQPMVTTDRDLKKVADRMGRTYATAQNYGEEGLSKLPGINRLRSFSSSLRRQSTVPPTVPPLDLELTRSKTEGGQPRRKGDAKKDPITRRDKSMEDLIDETKFGIGDAV